ncbi:MAG: 1-phosphofructokinase [Treponema sp.]|nr:1-phosphofructokinase [Treponema sp.]
MIYTVTVNPSLDYIVDVCNFRPGTINRTSAEKITAGGKGINVSIVLGNLGIENRALGFTAGFTGSEIERRLQEQGVKTQFIHVAQGFSRINVKMRSVTGTTSPDSETEINGRGPEITQKDIDALYAVLDTLQEDDTLVLAGSIPSTLPLKDGQGFYSEIMAHLHGRGIRVAVDATGELLKKSLAYKPFLVKPNNLELGEIFGVTLKTREEVIPYAEKLRDMGAQNVLASIAEQGAVLAASDGHIYQGPAPHGSLVNSVGAGDSMMAGFIAGYQQTGSFKEALALGLCAGTASACSDHLADRKTVQQYLEGYTGIQG